MLMRCTRCDGLAVPQAVGIDPQGKVIFGWCLQCLADRGCTLVETSPMGGVLSTSPTDPPRGVGDRTTGRAVSAGVGGFDLDPARWVVGVVALLMIGWGLILLAVGLCGVPRPGPEGSPLGNGTSAFLVGGGAATALLGGGLLVLASRRNWYPGTFLLAFLSWFSFLLGLAILAHGIVLHDPRRYVGLVLGVGFCMGISALARIIHRAQARKSFAQAHAKVPISGPGEGKPRTADWRPLL